MWPIKNIHSFKFKQNTYFRLNLTQGQIWVIFKILKSDKSNKVSLFKHQKRGENGSYVLNCSLNIPLKYEDSGVFFENSWKT